MYNLGLELTYQPVINIHHTCTCIPFTPTRNVLQNHSENKRLPQLTIVLSSQNLRCNVVGCATEGGSGVPRSQPLFTHPIICQLNVTVSIQQYIVQLQISIDYACVYGCICTLHKNPFDTFQK